MGVIRMGPEVMSTSCADVMITLLRNGIVRNDRDTNKKYIFEMYIIKFLQQMMIRYKILYDKQIELYVKQMFQLKLLECLNYGT